MTEINDFSNIQYVFILLYLPWLTKFRRRVCDKRKQEEQTSIERRGQEKKQAQELREQKKKERSEKEFNDRKRLIREKEDIENARKGTLQLW
jgi:hypothetical protein